MTYKTEFDAMGESWQVYYSPVAPFNLNELSVSVHNDSGGRVADFHMVVGESPRTANEVPCSKGEGMLFESLRGLFSAQVTVWPAEATSAWDYRPAVLAGHKEPELPYEVIRMAAIRAFWAFTDPDDQ